jgi:hypothetical protein
MGHRQKSGSHNGCLVLAQVAKTGIATGSSAGPDADLRQTENTSQEWFNQVDRLGSR